MIKHYALKSSRFIHTLLFLRLVQIAWRGKRLGPFPRQRRINYTLRLSAGPWCKPLAKPISLLGPARFRFLNAEHEIRSAARWSDATLPRLWLYNLHYFDDLNAANSSERAAWHTGLVERWIVENPHGQGPGWEAYPLSRRIVNWVKWLQLGPHPSALLLESLAQQAEALSRSLEYHLLGNHLLANAVALIHAGLFFAGKAADHWYMRGRKILLKQLPEQILSDGGHFERSPMYHCIVLEDLLDVANIAAGYGRALHRALTPYIDKMLAWLAVMQHPDGCIPFFNDSTLNVAAQPKNLRDYAQRLGFPARAEKLSACVWLRESGYARVTQDALAVFCSMTPIKPAYMPGHAHADTLSFELSLHGNRMIVNSGISTYEPGRQRLQQRGSSAHNTLVIDDADSSHVWSAFRVAERARIRQARVSDQVGGVEVTASHDGYRRLTGRPLHRRHWRVTDTGLSVNDTVTGKGRHEIMLHFHFHPSVTLKRLSANKFIARNHSSRAGLQIVVDSKSCSEIIAATYHPEFGRCEPTLKIVSGWYGPLPVQITTEMRLLLEGAGFGVRGSGFG